MIENEVSLMEGLDHPNIVGFLGSHRGPKHLFILMEYVAGKSVDDIVKEFGPQKESVLRNFVTQILKGLVYCHSKKVIHRDIKGKNILLSADCIVKIADFGSAKIVDNILKDEGLSTSYHYTPLWLAPEVVSGKYNSKVDIWSLGCTMLEMGSGKDPWYEQKFENTFQALYFIANSGQYPKFPSHLSPVAIDFLKACFTRDPEKRPSAEDLLKHEFIVKGAKPTTVPKSPTPLSPTPLSPTHSNGFSTTRKTDDSPTGLKKGLAQGPGTSDLLTNPITV